MSDDPWGDLKSNEFSAEDRQKIRFIVGFVWDNIAALRRVFTVMRVWWLFALGVGTSATGWLSKAFEALRNM